MKFLAFHQILERKSILLLLGIVITVAIGGLVEIVHAGASLVFWNKRQRR